MSRDRSPNRYQRGKGSRWPCEACPLLSRCTAEELAGRVYAAWLDHGRIEDLPRVPSSALYAELYAATP